MAYYDTVIVSEKPGVALAFAKYLAGRNFKKIRLGGVVAYEFRYNGSTWLSLGISGHIMNFDFPQEYNRWGSIDPRKLFAIDPIQVIRKASWKYAKALLNVAKKTDRVILALDADVEGESIAFEVMKIMSKANPHIRFERAWFSAVTKSDLIRAIYNLKKPNENLANKAFARMVVDLTIGAAFTRALTLMVQKRKNILPRGKFLSYGPCQTPVLFLVVKRAVEREKFRKKKYYVLVASLGYNGSKFKAQVNLGENREKAYEVFTKVRKYKRAIVKRAEYKDQIVKPPVPLNTIDFERRASHFLNIRAKEALSIAEDLYQSGLISYPRTDTNIYPPTLNLKALATMFKEWEDIGWFVKKNILSRDIKPTRGKEDDKAHPPIYPTRAVTKEDVERRFGKKGWLVYNLVVRHFLATLSPPAQIERQRIEVDIGGIKLEAVGRKIIEEGFYYVYPFERPREESLPYLIEGDSLEILKVELKEKTTQPPPYLSEAELLRLMKRYGIGTDATMQDHIHTNIERKYFIIKAKRCIPTPLGKTLALSLYQNVPEIVVPEVRGKMEKELQKIADGLREPREVIEEIKEEFIEYYDRLLQREEELANNLINALREIYVKDNKNSRSNRSRDKRSSRRYKRRRSSSYTDRYGLRSSH